MPILKRLLASLLGLTLACSAMAVNFLTEENPPLNMLRKGEVAGVSTDAVREMARRASVPANVTLLPWTDAYARAQKETDTCVFSTVRNPEREKKFIWLGPIARGEWSLFAREGFPPDVKQIEAFKKYRVGVVNDARVGYLRSRGFDNLVVAEQSKDLPAQLAAGPNQPGTIDLWFTQTAGGPAMAAEAGVKDLKVVFSALMSQDYWVACNPGMAADTAKALRDASTSMRADGTYKKLAARAQ
ncbi:MAG: transporter substrate-binding domain-containing protein [Rhodoferax sp.]|nr:transporter substrate-binding domain-containing protein [Rhodoferax sp.]